MQQTKQNFTIWVVEDDLVIAQKLKEILEQWSFRVILAQNFENLVAEFQTLHPDLVLLDYMLPVENGMIVCQRIRQKAREIGLPDLIQTIRGVGYRLMGGKTG